MPAPARSRPAAPCTPRGGDDAALLPQVVDEYAHVGGRVDRGGVDWMIVGLHGRMVATVMLRLAAPRRTHSVTGTPVDCTRWSSSPIGSSRDAPGCAAPRSHRQQPSP